MKKIIIMPNLSRDKDGKGTEKVINCLKQHGIEALIDNSLKEYGFDCKYVDIKNEKDADMAIIIGGDGTILTNSHLFVNTTIPVLGINHGNVGFLTELEKDDIDGLNKILDGNFIIERRQIIKVEYCGKTCYSINESAIHRGNSPKILNMEIIINGVSMNKYRADGLIVATSSGSTAYSLSAGGPIIHPLVDAFVITPVCAHNLYIRSMVIPTNETICIKLNSPDLCAFSVDGNLIAQMDGNQEIKLTMGGYLNTVICNENSFYNKIKTKIFEKEI